MMVCLSWLSDMVPNWRVLKDGWGRPGIGAERWLESPDVAIADTGHDDRTEAFFGESSTRVCVSRPSLCVSDSAVVASQVKDRVARSTRRVFPPVCPCSLDSPLPSLIQDHTRPDPIRPSLTSYHDVGMRLTILRRYSSPPSPRLERRGFESLTQRVQGSLLPGSNCCHQRS